MVSGMAAAVDERAANNFAATPAALQSADALPSDATRFVGLAPFLRMSIAGQDVLAEVRGMLARAHERPEDANLWMNLATATLSVGQRDLGLAMQAHALGLARTYLRHASIQPSRRRLLLLAAPGDLSANTPLDCLLEHSDVDLLFHYPRLGEDLAAMLPEHDALLVAASESDDNRGLLHWLDSALEGWPKPVLNVPRHIPSVGREAASRLLADAPGILMPPSRRLQAAALRAVAEGRLNMAALFEQWHYPVIVRPVDSHAGRGLERIDGPAGLAAYLDGMQEAEYIASPFVDYSGADALFRKFRIALIDGRAYACHMAVSSHWMVHYVNAGMYEDAARRDAEARFMADFPAFARRHEAALAAIAQRTRLDYVCIDAAETRDGRLLVFEIDHAMVVHAMDSEALFPFKQVHMQKVHAAFRAMLEQRLACAAAPLKAGATAAAAISHRFSTSQGSQP